ncbi:MAG: dienelactone hydrolase family protein [Candidatus Eisenbacteria bacterium]|uniref:Dienelactone hydrolase family protein n=1 Tax=Eiseniibacteriota bacterium TaxID=2212470 RepID=A0A849SR62_UNCEI|nr:dienelactone hydrolase family protein [Candidatus Eisenbacteria bacterium]
MHSRLIRAFVALALASIISPAFAAAPATFPPGEADAKARLNSTPRHGEFIEVPSASGPRRAWISYPERSDRAGVVIVIHEIFGLSDWIRSVGDQLAADGFIAVVPDLLSGLGPGGGGTDSFPTRDDVVRGVRSLSASDADARLSSVRAWANRLPAANGKWATLGFCWGGARSFEMAAQDTAPDGAVVYYGAAPDSLTLTRVRAPILGHFGADDARVNGTLPPARVILAAADRSFEVQLHAGAGHGFLRQQADREGANLKAARAAWPSTVKFLRQRLK